jgi:DNA gyrase subunit B
VHPTVIGFSDETTTGMRMSVEVAMQWNDSYSESVYTFANTINTAEGGTHEEGFRTALTTTFNDWARSKGHIKEKDSNLEGSDIREGLTAIISLKIADPQFEGQTEDQARQLRGQDLRAEGDPRVAQGLVRPQPRRRQAHRPEGDAGRPGPAWPPVRPASSRAARAARVLLAAGKLADCQSTDPRESEIYVVEGDSAGGSAKGGRDSKFQAILPIRGKILNVEKARIDRVLNNNEVQAMITALGCGSTRSSTSASCATTRWCSWPTPTSTASTSGRCC